MCGRSKLHPSSIEEFSSNLLFIERFSNEDLHKEGWLLHSPFTHIIGVLNGQYMNLSTLHSVIELTHNPVSQRIGAVIGHYEIYLHYELELAQDMSGHLIGVSLAQGY